MLRGTSPILPLELGVVSLPLKHQGLIEADSSKEDPGSVPREDNVEIGQGEVTDDHCAYMISFRPHKNSGHILLLPHFTGGKTET